MASYKPPRRSASSGVNPPTTPPARPLPTGDDAVLALLGVLAATQDHFARLLDLSEQKLDALRGANAQKLQSCAHIETHVLAEVFELDQQRAALLAQVAQALPGLGRRGVTLREIAAALPEPRKSLLEARNAGLRQFAEKLQQRNRIVAEVAHDLHEHLHAVFAAVANANAEQDGYGRDGQQKARRSQHWVDAVG